MTSILHKQTETREKQLEAPKIRFWERCRHEQAIIDRNKAMYTLRRDFEKAMATFEFRRQHIEAQFDRWY